MSPSKITVPCRFITFQFFAEDLDRADELKGSIASNEKRYISRAEVIRRAIRIGLVQLEDEFGAGGGEEE